jgi:Flp pilus assembly secretin CpaC
MTSFNPEATRFCFDSKQLFVLYSSFAGQIVWSDLAFTRGCSEMSGLLARYTCASSRTLVALIVSAALFGTMALNAIQAQAGELIVKYDQSQLLRLPRPVSEIIIGNPTIADITVQGKRLLVVTGKSFGHTNIILLDSEQNVIQESRVVVVRDQSQVVNLRRGTGRESYNCSPRCNPTVTIGDEVKYFTNAAKTAGMKIKMSGGGKVGGGGGQ